jgi:O-antigen/teichoic acid export membrane protein
MSGYQRFSIYSLGASTIFNIIFNLILTPKYGIVGTAIATAGSIAIWNCLMYFFVRNKLRVKPTAFGIA